MLINMTDRVMVTLTGLGVKIYQKRQAELETLYGRSGMPQVVVYEERTVMRCTLRMLFAIYGDHMATKNRHRRVFEGDQFLFEDPGHADSAPPISGPTLTADEHGNRPRGERLLIPRDRKIISLERSEATEE